MGKHGGINILHQKSWHVWRLDNRLIVERDELKHAAEQREKKTADDQTAFSAKLAKLRCRAEGKDEEEAALAQRAFLEAACGGGSSSSARGVEEAEKNKKTNAKKEASYKYGMVTTSNLKKAEDDLDARLKGSGRLPEAKGKEAAKGKGKGKGKGKEKGKDQGVREADSLGSGPHINLFEAAEQEQLQHLEEHKKQVGYTERNNELGGKSKKAMFSEFDEIANDVPWYCKSGSSETVRGRAAETGGPGAGKPGSAPSEPQHLGVEHVQRLALRSRSRSRSKLRRRWRHGQAVLQVKSARSCKSEGESESLKDEEWLKLESCKAEVKLESLKDEDLLSLQRCKAEVKLESLKDEDATAGDISSSEMMAVSTSIKTKRGDTKEKKTKKEKKEETKEKVHKKHRREDRKEKEKQELADLRLQRAQREAKERARTAGLLGAL